MEKIYKEDVYDVTPEEAKTWILDYYNSTIKTGYENMDKCDYIFESVYTADDYIVYWAQTTKALNMTMITVLTLKMYTIMLQVWPMKLLVVLKTVSIYSLMKKFMTNYMWMICFMNSTLKCKTKYKLNTKPNG